LEYSDSDDNDEEEAENNTEQETKSQHQSQSQIQEGSVQSTGRTTGSVLGSILASSQGQPGGSRHSIGSSISMRPAVAHVPTTDSHIHRIRVNHSQLGSAFAEDDEDDKDNDTSAHISNPNRSTQAPVLGSVAADLW
jgi:hypothetical protein